MVVLARELESGMIDHNRDLKLFEISCDRCPTGTMEVDSDHGWHSMMEDIEEAGWSVIKDEDDEYEHVCPDCADDIEGMSQ